ncbi:MAG: DoxX family protein [Candidatus Acidiferrales bacterium]|jgi:putative oxidoreductase
MGSNRVVALLGRILVAVPFLVFGEMKIAQFHFYAGLLAAMKVPKPTIALVIVIIIEVLGGICLAVGFKARLWAWLMFLYLIPVTFTAHNFWTYTGAARLDNEIHFMKNVAILGGLLLIAAFGPGSLSADKT